MPLRLGPPHPIRTDRLERYVTSRRVRYAISAAYSTKLNPRNNEVDWYSPWNHIFSDLVDIEFDGVLTVKQQHDIWLSKATIDIYKLTPEALEAANSIDEIANSADNSEEEALDEEHAMPPPLLDLAPAAPAPPVGAPPAPEEELPPLPIPPPFPDVASAAPAPPVGAPSALPEHDHHPDAPALVQEDNLDVQPSRPKRQRKPPPAYPSGYIASDSVRAILYPESDGAAALTAEEQLAAIKNVLARAKVVDNPSDATLKDASIATVATVPDNKGQDTFPDLLVCHTHALDMQSPEDNPTQTMLGRERRMGLKIVHHCFPVVMEIKGCPRRLVRDEQEQKERARVILNEAEDDLYDYLCTCFARDLCANSVIAVSAAGPYWRWIEVSRHQVDEDILSASNVRRHKAFMARFKNAKIFALGSAASDAELNRLRNEGLIPILTDHFRYPSTLVANPPRPPKGKAKAAQAAEQE